MSLPTKRPIIIRWKMGPNGPEPVLPADLIPVEPKRTKPVLSKGPKRVLPNNNQSMCERMMALEAEYYPVVANSGPTIYNQSYLWFMYITMVLASLLVVWH